MTIIIVDRTTANAISQAVSSQVHLIGRGVVVCCFSLMVFGCVWVGVGGVVGSACVGGAKVMLRERGFMYG
jgi:hypothetical protein